jgi:hypothetical protein
MRAKPLILLALAAGGALFALYVGIERKEAAAPVPASVPTAVIVPPTVAPEITPQVATPRQPDWRPRSEFALLDGKLRPLGGGEPFTGTLYDKSSKGAMIAELPVRDGLVHGLARGWHENGQVEVEEPFVDGLSHGERIRWHANGSVRSKANIVRGVLQGSFTEWHPNGQMKTRMNLVDGLGEGLCETWAETGQALPPVTLKAGQPVGALANAQ